MCHKNIGVGRSNPLIWMYEKREQSIGCSERLLQGIGKKIRLILPAPNQFEWHPIMFVKIQKYL